MSCIVQGIARDCNYNISGLKEVRLAFWRESLIIDRIGDLFQVDGSVQWEEHCFEPLESSFTQTLTVTANGNYYEVSLDLSYLPLKQSTNDVLKDLAEMRIFAIVTDKNDRIWLLGAENGLRMLKRTDTTGSKNQNGKNGYSVSFVGTGLGSIVELDNIPSQDRKWVHWTIHYRNTDTTKLFYVPHLNITDFDVIDVLTGGSIDLSFGYSLDDTTGCLPDVDEINLTLPELINLITTNNQPFTVTINVDNFNNPLDEGCLLIKYKTDGVAPIINTFNYALEGISKESQVGYEDKITIDSVTIDLGKTWRAGIRTSVSDDFTDFPHTTIANLNAAIAATTGNYIIHWFIISPNSTVNNLSYTYDYTVRDDIEYAEHFSDATNNEHRPYEKSMFLDGGFDYTTTAGLTYNPIEYTQPFTFFAAIELITTTGYTELFTDRNDLPAPHYGRGIEYLRQLNGSVGGGFWQVGAVNFNFINCYSVQTFVPNTKLIYQFTWDGSGSAAGFTLYINGLKCTAANGLLTIGTINWNPTSIIPSDPRLWIGNYINLGFPTSAKVAKASIVNYIQTPAELRRDFNRGYQADSLGNTTGAPFLFNIDFNKNVNNPSSPITTPTAGTLTDDGQYLYDFTSYGGTTYVNFY